MKKTLLLLFVFLLSLSLFGCASAVNAAPPEKEEQHKEEPVQISESKKEESSLDYKNTQYGFSFSLPKAWEGYTIVNDKWEGLAIDSSQGDKVAATGPKILVRHPQWTKENPRQDIPIMIFTHEQWNMLQQEKFHIGAAPIGPSELGRNSKYVFALPARYNFAFPAGYEEVENILQSKPLHPISE